MSSKGQNQLLQAAIRNRRLQAGEQHSEPAELYAEEVQPIEQHDVGEIAGPIVDAPESQPSRSFEPTPTNDTPHSISEEMDSEDSSAVAAPLVNARKHYNQVQQRYTGNLLKHPTIEADLREHFGKVQVGDDRIVVAGFKRELDEDAILDFISKLILDHNNFNGDAFRGSRPGRYRIIARN